MFTTGLLILKIQSEDVKIIKKLSYCLSLIIKDFFLDYDGKLNKLILEGQILPCLQSDGFCKPTLKHPHTIVWFPEETCLMVHISDCFGRKSKLNKRFWCETLDFINSNRKTTEKINEAIMSSVFLYTNSPLGTTTPNLTRLEIFPRNSISMKNQQRCIQLSILICSRFSVKVLMWTLERKTQLLLMKIHPIVNSHCLQHCSLTL